VLFCAPARSVLCNIGISLLSFCIIIINVHYLSAVLSGMLSLLQQETLLFFGSFIKWNMCFSNCPIINISCYMSVSQVGQKFIWLDLQHYYVLTCSC